MYKNKILLNLHMVKDTPAEVLALLMVLLKSRGPNYGDEHIVEDCDDDVEPLATACKYFHLDDHPPLPFLTTGDDLCLEDAIKLFPDLTGLPGYESVVQFSSEENCEMQLYMSSSTNIYWKRLFSLLQFISPWLDNSSQPVAVLMECRDIDDRNQQPMTHVWINNGELHCSKIEGGDLDHGYSTLPVDQLYELVAEAAAFGELVEIPLTVRQALETYSAPLREYVQHVTDRLETLIYQRAMIEIAGVDAVSQIQTKLHTAMNKMLIMVYSESLAVDNPCRMYLAEVPLYDACMKLVSHPNWTWEVHGKSYGNSRTLEDMADNDVMLRMFHNVNEDFCTLQRERLSDLYEYL